MMRKRILLLALVLISGFHLSAQLEPGHIYGGLSAGYNIRTYKPAIGGRTSLQLALGKRSSIGFFYDYSRTKDYHYLGANQFLREQSFGITYSYHRFFGRSQSWGWFVNGTLSYDRFKNSQKYPGGTSASYGYDEIDLTIRPGIFFKPSKGVMLHASLIGASYSKNYCGPGMNLGFSPQVHVGITLDLGSLKKKK